MLKDRKSRSLRLIIILLVAINMLIFSGIFFFIFQTSMPGMLLQAESNYLQKQMEVVSGAFSSAQERVLRMTDDLGIWNETSEFVNGSNPDFIQKNWAETPLLQAYSYNFLIIKDKNGNDLHIEFYDYLNKKSLPAPAGFSDSLRGLARQVFEQHSSPQDATLPLSKWGRGGILFFKGTAYNLAIMPVMPSRDAAPPVGVAIMGSILDSAYFRDLTHYTASHFEVTQDKNGGNSGTIAINRESESTVSTSLSLKDLEGNPASLHISAPRSIYTDGQRVLGRTTLMLIGVMALYAVALYQIVQRRVLLPLERLSGDISDIASTGSITAEKYSGGKEFVTLCASINAMLQRISQSQVSIELLRRILNGIDAYLYVTDPETDTILFINDKMREHYALGEGGVGQICWQVLQSGMTQRCDFCPNFKLEKDPGSTVVWEEHSTLTAHYYRNTDCFIDWPGGKKVHLQHSVDITESKMLEMQLIAAKEHAEQSSRAKGEFLSRMSHEMRTPLNAIIGMTSIAQSTKELDKKEYCLEKIDGASKHLLGVINDILDMSKIEANKFELSYTEFVFEKMLMRVVNIVNFRVEEKHQTLIIDIGQDVPYSIAADEQRLAQVITNLLSNAVKFTPDHGTITLSAHYLTEDNGLCTLRIDVKDTGIGIAEGQQHKLFHSFEQADGGIARKFGGTGLGLAISKSIVELMGGDIWVESTAGQGSTFAFTIKVQRGNLAQAELPAPAIQWNTLRVLAVDDAPEVREYFTSLAQAIGFSCDTAADGFEACGLFDGHMANPFNIVFADWQMPGMNGIELTRCIKERFGDASIVIMISATEWNEIEQDAKEAGVDGFLPKPLFPSRIIDCITMCLGASHCPDPQPAVQPDAEGSLAAYRVLLAEDIDINREIVASLLESTGIGIDFAENGQQAYEMFNGAPSRYSLIFMDIHMPEVDGYEATRRIRAIGSQQARDIPIIAMTANVFREDIERCLAAGMTDHIGKPINVEEIIIKLNKHLNIT